MKIRLGLDLDWRVVTIRFIMSLSFGNVSRLSNRWSQKQVHHSWPNRDFASEGVTRLVQENLFLDGWIWHHVFLELTVTFLSFGQWSERQRCQIQKYISNHKPTQGLKLEERIDRSYEKWLLSLNSLFAKKFQTHGFVSVKKHSMDLLVFFCHRQIHPKSAFSRIICVFLELSSGHRLQIPSTRQQISWWQWKFASAAMVGDMRIENISVFPQFSNQHTQLPKNYSRFQRDRSFWLGVVCGY